MDPESKKLLEVTYALEKENNNMLRAMKRSMAVAYITNVIYWIIIIGISIGAFYFVQPYVDQIVQMYKSASTTFKNFQNFPQ